MLGIGTYPRTFRFLRAVRTHLTTARYGLLAALSRTNAMCVTHVAIAARALSPSGDSFDPVSRAMQRPLQRRSVLHGGKNPE